MSSESYTKYAFTTVITITAIYYIIQRKKRVNIQTSSESFINNRNGSWYVYIYVYENIYMYQCVYIDTCVYVCLHLHLYIHMCVCMYYLWIHICFHTCMRMYMYRFDFSGKSQDSDGHPEGPNIGYNSNSSWFDNQSSGSKGTYMYVYTFFIYTSIHIHPYSHLPVNKYEYINTCIYKYDTYPYYIYICI